MYDQLVEPPLREDALDGLRRTRAHLGGPALFSTLPPRRQPRLLRLLVAYQLLVDFLDCASERGQLARHPGSDDAGYLRALVAARREGASSLARE